MRVTLFVFYEADVAVLAAAAVPKDKRLFVISLLIHLLFFCHGRLKGLSGHRSPSEKDNYHKPN